MKLRGLFLCSLLVWSASLPARGENEGLQEAVTKAQVAMDASRWEEALDLNKRVVSRYGLENPLGVYGAQFGAVYFRKGLCEMKLKRWDAAMRSFEICYRDFPNEGVDKGNDYQKLALLKWGEAAMGAEAWELAILRFTKFTDERDRQRDTFAQGFFYISLAVCQYKLGHISEGNENLEIAIRNRINFLTPDSGIIAGFQALVETALANKDEQALLDFIGKNRSGLITPQEAMQEFSPVLLKLAGDALAGGMQRAAVAIYQLVPDTSDGTTERIKLAAVALIHERSGHLRGAFAAYQQLERYFPSASGRESDLYHLVRVAVLLREEKLAQLYAGRLLVQFPGSVRLGELREAEIDFPKTNSLAPPLKQEAAVVSGSALPQTLEFTAAIDLYQGRNYREAALAFSKIQRGTEERAAMFAEFYGTECLRKLGDREGLMKAVESLEKNPLLGATRLRQLKIDSLWESVRAKNWTLLARQASEWLDHEIPSDQRAQVALCHGLALENLGRPAGALDAYCIAMTADAGASEEIAREAALNVLGLHHSNPEVQAALAGGAAAPASSLGIQGLKEATALARLFESTLGAGTALPEKFKGFLNPHGSSYSCGE
jgi:hypothetical protein